MPSWLFLLSLGSFLTIGHGIVVFPDREFAECCNGIPLKPATVKDACHYPPSPLSDEAKLDIARHWNPYIDCYAHHWNNTKCCVEHGVVGEFAQCTQLCDATQKYPPPGPGMYICATSYIEKAISDCNKDTYFIHVEDGISIKV